MLKRPGDKFTFTVRIWSQEYFVRTLGCCFQFVDKLVFFLYNFVLWRKVFARIYSQAFLGKSIICPIEAFTSKSRPRNFSIVFAFAGDSTITSFFAIHST